MQLSVDMLTIEQWNIANFYFVFIWPKVGWAILRLNVIVYFFILSNPLMYHGLINLVFFFFSTFSLKNKYWGDKIWIIICLVEHDETNFLLFAW